MKKLVLVTGYWLLVIGSFGQSVDQRLQKAYQQFENDQQLKHAISSLYVIDAKTGAVVFDKNSQIGLAPASTQKIVTAATAFELLGKNYKYKTEVGYNGEIKKRKLNGNLFLMGSGDPTFGSWRYASTKRDSIIDKIINGLKSNKIDTITGNFYVDAQRFSFQPTPGGWIWEDIGNYYGAGTWALNWNENQFNLILQPGKKVGDTTVIVGINPENIFDVFNNQIITGGKGTGDNGYIYLPPYSTFGYSQGTIPLQDKEFTISGSLPYPGFVFEQDITKAFDAKNINFLGDFKSSDFLNLDKQSIPKPTKYFFTYYSPSLDSIIYWFLKKSINLYGEALVKTFAYEKNGFGSTDSGVAIIRRFWKEKGIHEDELNLYDGSGLSPLNRITTHAQVEILKYAKTKDWFSYYLTAFPDYNEMKMKSGTISDVKAFCGYHTSKDGKEYIFSFLVNNYSGSASSLVSKMYKVLDELK